MRKTWLINCVVLFAFLLGVSNDTSAQNNVTFRVNMKVKILERLFRPGAGDIVRVAGSFNDWGNSRDTLRDLTPIDSVYEKTISLPTGDIQYKFLRSPRGGDWESVPNRTYTVVAGSQTLPVVRFDNDSIVNPVVEGNILWRSDMRAYLQLGWFTPDSGDGLEFRGALNSWSGGTPMTENTFIPGIYEATTSYIVPENEATPFKMRMNLDSAHAVRRFPGWNDDRDGHNYEHPAERGDGNRQFNVGNVGGNLTAPSYYFSSINTRGILRSPDTCRITVRVNMGPATRQVPPFVPGTDTVRFRFEDKLQVANQRRWQGTFANTLVMNRVADTIYSISFKYRGPAHYNILYSYAYTHSGSTIGEGAGLGAQNGYRSRFIAPILPNVFPATYSTPQENWVGINPPYPVEVPPFIITGVREDAGTGIPEAYTLSQNYPNPFNPSTQIRYSIPEAARVTLKIFNMLGQEVATVLNEQQTKGSYIATFDANNFATGVYFYRLEAGKFSETKKMLLMK